MSAAKSLSEIQASDEAAIAAALPAYLGRSYARYSNFTVASAVVDDQGGVHFGVNVENAAYPSGTCAEQTAIGAMVTAGGRRIERVYIAAGSDAVVQPCGACRQRIGEFAARTCEIVSVQGGAATKRTPFWSLLPEAFGPGDLE
ncbi:cytidine deaminase [Caulobacter sp. D4A]|uniref:cytidine deaminase n=1 Tax=unclassified Caulobacter TaxID=2648921 RepID=UPI000D73EF2B|nr:MULTISPECIES: cytidine deaminase [unclassified Caulobacter]PXA79495.1 cytidine deaminase [Caulobacter sp. D4A]PXA88760.1 cytidine deaminase [Caulobacter sp. D5]